MAKKRKPFRPRNLSGQYIPSAFGGGAGWSGYGSSILDGKPYFIPDFDIPRMMNDPLIKDCLSLLASPFAKVKWTVKCDDETVAEFVDSTYRKFWQEMLPVVVKNYFLWGYAPYLLTYDDDDGVMRLTGGRAVWPRDATPHVHLGGRKAGQFAGFELAGVNDRVNDGNNVIECPEAFWFGGFEERGGRLYDHSRLKYAYEPWLEKETRGGIKETEKLFHHKWGVPTSVVYYPPGLVDPTDPSSERNKDIAYDVASNLAAGRVVIMPDTRTPDDKGDPKWRIEVLDSPKPGFSFMEALDYRDKMIMKGMGIPSELVEASETGSGYSGRQIPMDMFLGMTDQIVGLLIRQIDHCIVSHLVDHNFGDEIKYEIEAEPIANTVAAQGQEGQPGGNPADPMAALGGAPEDAGGGGVPGAAPMEMGGAPQPAAEDEGGGDPTAGGLVPYLGKRGGRGKKDPKSGRVYYNMSHDGRRMGCLLAPVHGPLRDAVLTFGRTIPADELASDGLEDDPHLTLRYGLHTDDDAAVFGAVSPLGSLSFRPGPLAVFEGPEHDVLHVSCANAECPSKWYDSLSHLTNTTTHAGYVPHVTVAYLKKGEGSKYVGKSVCDCPCDIPAVEYHGPNGTVSNAPVWPSADELKAMLECPVNMGWIPEYYTGRDGRTKVKAVGTAEHATLKHRYGADAEAVLNQEMSDPDPAFTMSPSQRDALAQSRNSGPDDEAKSDGKTLWKYEKPAIPTAKTQPAQPKTQPAPAKSNTAPLTKPAPAPAPSKTPAPPQNESTLSDGRKIKFVPQPKRQNATVVNVDPAKLDAAWSADEGFYIPPGGGGAEIGGRRAGFERFMKTGKDVEMPHLSVGADGDVSFEDGRHRFSVLRDMGIDSIPVTVDADSAESFAKKFAPSPTKTPSPPPKPATSKPAPAKTATGGQQQPLVDQLKRDGRPAAPKVNPLPIGKTPAPASAPAKPKPPVAHPVKTPPKPIPFKKTAPIAEPVKTTTPMPKPIPFLGDKAPPTEAKPLPTATRLPNKDRAPIPMDPERHVQWASDKVASMSDQISQKIGKPLTKPHLQAFQAKAQEAMRQAIASGKSSVRVPVTFGGKTLYVVIKRKQKTNLSHVAGDGWELSVED